MWMNPTKYFLYGTIVIILNNHINYKQCESKVLGKNKMERGQMWLKCSKVLYCLIDDMDFY